MTQFAETMQGAVARMRDAAEAIPDKRCAALMRAAIRVAEACRAVPATNDDVARRGLRIKLYREQAEAERAYRRLLRQLTQPSGHVEPAAADAPASITAEATDQVQP
jgi:hypothetical protein